MTILNKIINFDYNSVDYEHVNDFSMTFCPVTRNVGTWRDEMKNTVINIANSTNKPIVLCFSGGIDSEVIAREMIANKIDFSVLTIRQKDNVNEYDISWAINFCQTYKVKQNFIEFDPEDFFFNQVPEYRKQGYIARRPWRYFHIHLVELVEAMGGTAIIGSGEQIYKTVNNEICAGYSSEYVLCAEWCKRHDILHYPYFHLQNPELLAAYMKTDLVDLLLSNPDNFKSVKFNTSLEKILVSHRYYPDMIRRDKYDGFEQTPAYKEFIKQNWLAYPNFIDYNIPVSKIKKELGIG